MLWQLACCVAFAEAALGDDSGDSRQWQVPLAGNAYTPNTSVRLPVQRDSTVLLGSGNAAEDGNRRASQRSAAEVDIYFYLDRGAKIQASLLAEARKPSAESTAPCEMKLTLGKQSATGQYDSKAGKVEFGEFKVDRAGYVKATLSIIKGQVAASDLVLRSNAGDVRLNCVATNKGNMFYWGRRGPSVHLTYAVPKGHELEYAYSEITVPEGQDRIGSYFMANGFGEGYFGFQVNSPTERRVLFSVWSPFNTQDPSKIPPDQRIQRLASGEKVHVGKFGNEGSGGQSYLKYPWVAGRTYRFLTRVQPMQDNKTVYTCWFGDKEKDEWLLIASFARPKTQTHLRRFHSFLENFAPNTGGLGRWARYDNIWVVDTDGKWFECTEARFSKDATGSGGHRLDYEGGVKDSSFYLKNCGFFNPSSKQADRLVREPNGSPPKIQFEQLPGWK